MHHKVWQTATTDHEVALLPFESVIDWLSCYYQSVKSSSAGAAGRRNAKNKTRKKRKAIMALRKTMGLPDS